MTELVDEFRIFSGRNRLNSYTSLLLGRPSPHALQRFRVLKNRKDKTLNAKPTKKRKEH
jgi:hypothetical protein